LELYVEHGADVWVTSTFSGIQREADGEQLGLPLRHDTRSSGSEVYLVLPSRHRFAREPGQSSGYLC